jgi:D-aminopeptidase
MPAASSPPALRPRARSYGLQFGNLPTGAHNAITDVAGLRVGHVTIWHDQAANGSGSTARTGVTAIVPDDLAAMFARPMAAGTAVLNGAGELTGSVTITEWGTIETPIMLTSTSAVGRVYDGVVDAMFGAGADEVVIPVVGECDDSWLDDMHGRWVEASHARAAIEGANSGPVVEGVVGAGTGMTTMGYKAGIGTASRVIEDLGTVGVLLLCNFGGRRQLRIGGVPIGEELHRDAATAAPTLDTGGSCLGVVATDLPLDARQLTRLARRVGLGMARVGSVAHHGSGDIFCAVSTTNRLPRNPRGRVGIELIGDRSLDDAFLAVVDATEEAVCNALFVADTVVGVDGHVAPGLPVNRVCELISASRGPTHSRA